MRATRLDDLVQNQRSDNNYIRFLSAVSTNDIKYDLGNKARSYLIGDSLRVWITHASRDWGGINVQRRELFQEEEYQLIHLLIRHSEDEFEYQLEQVHDDVSAVAGSLEWYALSDDALGQFVNEPASGQYHINWGFDLMGIFYQDGERLLH